jgi:hypothetical protein
MTQAVIRGVAGLLAAAMVAGVLAKPPATAGQLMGALFPVAMLLAVAIRGTRRSTLPRKKR